MKMRKRLVSLFAVVCLAVGLMPTVLTVSAAPVQHDTIIVGTDSIADPITTQQAGGTGNYYVPESYIYFGQDEDGTPIKWRVLDADKTNDGITDGIFVLSEYLLDAVDFDSNANGWQGSDAQAWCIDFAAYDETAGVFNALTKLETQALLGVDKKDEAAELYELTWGGYSSSADNCLKADVDKVFFLSAQELADYVGDFDGAPGLITGKHALATPDQWWLRTADAAIDYNAASVNFDGIVDVMFVNLDWATRPAANLDKDAVFMLSMAEGGKAAATGDLVTVDTTAAQEWKLTLLDESRSFSVAYEAGRAHKVAPGSKIKFEYNTSNIYDVASAPNEYVSVMISDNTKVLYYGRILQPAVASGTAEFTVPSALAAGDYTLTLFSEQYNGGAVDDTKLTDYASAPVELAFTVVADAGDLLLHKHTGGTADCGNQAKCDLCQEAYGDKATTHTGATEIRDAKDATYSEVGYTGDTYCKTCGTKLASGTAIPVLEKDDDSAADGAEPDDSEESVNEEAADTESKGTNAADAGDHSMAGLWCAVAGLCGAALICLMWLKRNKKQAGF